MGIDNTKESRDRSLLMQNRVSEYAQEDGIYLNAPIRCIHKQMDLHGAAE